MKSHPEIFDTTAPLPREGEGIKRHYRNAFTLAELLIALAILGVIATFTIPKILDSGSSSQNNAIAKEAASTISGAFQNYKLQNSISATTTKGAITSYMNYVGVYSTGSMDSPPGLAAMDCTTIRLCLRLHNGGLIGFTPTFNFGGTELTSSVAFNVDPDGQFDNDNNGIHFIYYINGRLTSRGHMLPNTYENGSLNATIADPSWFSWSN